MMDVEDKSLDRGQAYNALDNSTKASTVLSSVFINANEVVTEGKY
jgi:hypothetical protein